MPKHISQAQIWHNIWFVITDVLALNILVCECRTTQLCAYSAHALAIRQKRISYWPNDQWASSFVSLQWRHNERDCVSNHQPHNCLLNRLFGRRSKKTSKLRVTGFCEGNSPVTGEFSEQRASNAETVSIWWRNHGFLSCHHMAIHQRLDNSLWNVDQG